MIVAPSRRYLASASSFHSSAAASSSGCLPNAFVVRVQRRSRIVSLSATRQIMWSKRSLTTASFSADPQRNAVLLCVLLERVSTSARLIFQPKRPSQPAGTGSGGSVTTCPLARSTHWQYPSQSASTASSPRFLEDPRRPSIYRPLSFQSPRPTPSTKPRMGMRAAPHDRRAGRPKTLRALFAVVPFFEQVPRPEGFKSRAPLPHTVLMYGLSEAKNQ